MIFIPAIDIIDGRCVRLTEGDYGRRSDYGLEPWQAAARFEEEGAEWIHLIDLDGAKAGRPVNREAIAKVRQTVSARLEAGGGIRTLEHARILLDLGIDRVIFGTTAVLQPGRAAELFGELGERAVAGLDLRGGRPATHAWQEVVARDGLDLGRDLEAAGCRRFIVTDIATDGSLKGPNTDLMRQFAEGLSSPVIASGGVSCLEDLPPLVAAGVEGVIAGKAIYEGKLTVAEAVDVLRRTSYSSQGAS